MRNKRIIVALVVLCAFSAVGVAADVDGAESPTWVVPALQAGDQGRYVAGDESFVFSVDTERMLLGDGRIRDVIVVHVQGETEDGRVPTPVITAWVADGIAATRTWAGGDGAFGGVGVGDVQSFGGGAYDVYVTRWEADDFPCGLVHDGQGMVVKDSIQAHGCDARFERTGSMFRGPDGSIRLAEGIPVPLQIDWHGATWTLHEFARGDGVPSQDSTPARVDMASGRIPDAAGIDIGFNLDEALAFAQTPGIGLRLGAFLERPDAYVAAAYFTTQYAHGSREREWTIIASDGTQEVASVFTKTMAQADRTTADLPVGTGLSAPDGPAISWSDIEPPMIDFPHVDDLPATLPTLASVLALREQAFGAQRIDAWGFSHDCAECHSTVVWIGEHARQWFDPQYAGGLCDEICARATNLLMQDTLAVDGSGAPLERVTSDYMFVRQASAGVPVLDVEGQAHRSPEVELNVEGAWAGELGAAFLGFSLAGLAAALIVYFAPMGKNVAAIGLFSRVTRRTALDHPIRLQIMEAVEAEPGLHMAALARRIECNESTLRHHIQQLISADRIDVRAQGGFRCVFPARAASVPRPPSESATKILDVVRVRPGASMSEIASSARMSASQASYHVGCLVEAGLVERHRDGRWVRIFPASAAA